MIRLRASALHSTVTAIFALCWIVAFCCTTVECAAATTLEDAQVLFNKGKYDECIEVARAEVEKGVWHDGWSKLLMRALMTRGEYQQAVDVYSKVSDRYQSSLSLRMLAIEALRFSGKQADARSMLNQIPDQLRAAPWRYSDRENMIAVGNFMLSHGEDARDILTMFFDPTLKSDPKYVEGHIAIAELALSKNDFQEAVNSLRTAEKIAPEDPRIQFLLARAWAPSDDKKATTHLQKALEINPKHVDSLLLACDTRLDAEQFDEADKIIDEVLAINPKHAKAWALRAVIKHLRGEYQEEGACRIKALSTWAQNPQVDYEIGRKLSRFYRFADATQYLRRAISLDPNFLPARFQLAQDLLRLNATDEGWTMVDQVSAADKYNVVAANLRTLKDRLAQFTTLEAEGFKVRMDSREARIYGERVLRLLTRARKVLCEKYDVKIDEPVNVEIFPQQSDFAIRTFGLPGGAGFLGVCFGKLITANSPASQGESPTNWESVLWHEFCHVVTLTKSSNRMPRWLSEGISVYEELQENDSWGQHMTPAYRDMILGDEFVPLSKLSGAFLSPKSPMHLQFAYFESSLAVEYLIQVHGLDRLKKLLVDLGMGIPMESAMARLYGDADKMDEDFKTFAHRAANELFRDKVEDEELPGRMTIAQLDEFLTAHPKHYRARRALAQSLIAGAKWDRALEQLLMLDKLWPEDAEKGGVLDSLAAVYRKLDKPDEELKTLQRIIARDGDNLPAITRLIELDESRSNWEDLKKHAELMLAVQPLVSTGHAALAKVAESTKDYNLAAEAYAGLLELQPLDSGRIYYQLALSQYKLDKLPRARQYVLMALEQTPRYREAQLLLVKILEQQKSSGTATTLSLPDLNASPPQPSDTKMSVKPEAPKPEVAPAKPDTKN